MNLTQFIGLAASAGIISTVLTAILSGLGHWWSRSRQARFFALRLAVLFEDYASKCMDAYFDHENAESSRGAIGDYIVYLPTPPIIPEDDVSWPVLNHDATQRAFSFAGIVRQFNDKVRFNGEVTGEVNHDETIAEIFVTAERALILARDLRYRHEVGGLPENDARLIDLREWRDEHRAKLLKKEQRRKQRRLERAAAKQPGEGT